MAQTKTTGKATRPAAQKLPAQRVSDAAQARALIRAALTDGEMTLAQLRHALVPGELSEAALTRSLRAAVGDGELVRVRRGTYSLAPKKSKRARRVTQPQPGQVVPQQRAASKSKAAHSPKVAPISDSAAAPAATPAPASTELVAVPPPPPATGRVLKPAVRHSRSQPRTQSRQRAPEVKKASGEPIALAPPPSPALTAPAPMAALSPGLAGRHDAGALAEVAAVVAPPVEAAEPVPAEAIATHAPAELVQPAAIADPAAAWQADDRAGVASSDRTKSTWTANQRFLANAALLVAWLALSGMFLFLLGNNGGAIAAVTIAVLLVVVQRLIIHPRSKAARELRARARRRQYVSPNVFEVSRSNG